MKSQKDQMDGLKKMNAETLRLQQETAAKDAALEIMYQDQYTERQGLTLVNFSAPPERFLSPKPHVTNQRIPQKCSR
jgi:hypothetical protein